MSYSGFASGVASKLFALQKLTDSRIVDFPSKSFWLPFDDDGCRWCSLMPNSTRDARHYSLLSKKISVVDSTNLPGQNRLVPVHSEYVNVRTISVFTQTLN